ncbi:DUF1878 family protein [Bacillus kwashiorkori]|uniref:DUF1878 family protein n=1 Tax=Bacillus kwashiorkori TaxID=1522318 RepID=UPI0007825F2E|nr:DUF1878 family protein [Bacillus kwashiorkori]
MEEILKRIELLEYHQQLFIRLLTDSKMDFTKLIIEKNLTRQDVEEFHNLCDELHIKWEEQKAEGFVYFHPLMKEFANRLNKKLQVKETIQACINEGLYLELMNEFAKYVK